MQSGETYYTRPPIKVNQTTITMRELLYRREVMEVRHRDMCMSWLYTTWVHPCCVLLISWPAKGPIIWQNLLGRNVVVLAIGGWPRTSNWASLNWFLQYYTTHSICQTYIQWWKESREVTFPRTDGSCLTALTVSGIASCYTQTDRYYVGQQHFERYCIAREKSGAIWKNVLSCHAVDLHYDALKKTKFPDAFLFKVSQGLL